MSATSPFGGLVHCNKWIFTGLGCPWCVDKHLEADYDGLPYGAAELAFAIPLPISCTLAAQNASDVGQLGPVSLIRVR